MSDIVKLSATLPAGDANGLSALVSALTSNPTGMHVVLAIVDCREITTKTDTGELIPTARIRRIEALLASDRATGRQLIRRAFENRTGRDTLPIEIEEDLDRAFGQDPTR